MKPQENKDYEEWGVTPPSTETHGSMDDISAQLKQRVRHEWRQRGACLYCISCPNEHRTEPVFLDKILIGNNPDGSPILRDIKKRI